MNNAGRIIVPNPADHAATQRLYQQLAALPADLRVFMANTYQGTEVTVLPLPYWSTIRFQAGRDAGPPVSFTIPEGTRRAFAYAQGQDMTVGGFPPGTIANLADTNVLAQSQTRDNADVWIWGISCNLQPTSEPVLAARVQRECSIEIAMNGTQTIPLGKLEFYPGAGGLYGAGKTLLRAPDLQTAGIPDSGEGANVAFLANGNPQSGNFKRLPQPFKWSAIGSAGSDSSLSISFRINRAITEVMTARAAVAGAAPGLSGQVEAATPPAAAGDAGTFVEYAVQLICVAVQKRSVNV